MSIQIGGTYEIKNGSKKAVKAKVTDIRAKGKGHTVYFKHRVNGKIEDGQMSRRVFESMLTVK